MKSNRLIWILLAVLLTLAALFALLWSGNRGFHWVETYDEHSRQPYGTEVLFELLKKSYRLTHLEAAFHENLAEAPSPSSYVFVGDGILLDSLDEVALLDFVRTGHTAFIATNYLPESLAEKILEDTCFYPVPDEVPLLEQQLVSLHFYHPNLRADSAFTFFFQRRKDTLNYSWQYFPSEFYDSPCKETVRIGYMEDELVVFLEVPFGEGRFLLHSIPLVFTNLHLIETTGWEYFKRTFAHLPEGPVYFDSYSQMDAALARRMFGDMPPSNRTFDGGPLQYILRQPSLAWAWYLGLGMATLFLLFRAKRQQRVIPVLEPNTNTSLEFINTIGRLYFLQNTPKKLALQKMKLFLSFVRDRYHLPTRELDEAFAHQLHIRSEIPLDDIQQLLLFYGNIERGELLSDRNLAKFHRSIQEFYEKCK